MLKVTSIKIATPGIEARQSRTRKLTADCHQASKWHNGSDTLTFRENSPQSVKWQWSVRRLKTRVRGSARRAGTRRRPAVLEPVVIR